MIVIDNVNDVEIVNSIKTFGKFKNDYHIIMITSLKANLVRFKGEELQFKQMFPMDFEEYLIARDQKQLIDFIKESFKNNKPMPFHSVALDLFNEFVMTGGLPEVVEASINGADVLTIKTIQSKIRDTYYKDFYRMKNLIDTPRSVEVMNSAVYQLQKENRKFQYGLMGTGSRAKEYESSINF